jgi:hypothetical protein
VEDGLEAVLKVDPDSLVTPDPNDKVELDGLDRVLSELLLGLDGELLDRLLILDRVLCDDSK